jgi:hypothetical protein
MKRVSYILYIIFLSLLITQKVWSQNPIPIGFSNIEEQARNLQLLGKIDPNQSFSNRPFYTSQYQSYETLIAEIDNSFSYHSPQFNKGALHIEALPISFTQKYNSTRAFGWNDQAMGFSKDYQAQLTTGLYAKWGILHAQYQPELVHFASGDFTKKTKLLPGQSFVGIKAAGLFLGISSENLWWGPTRYSPLLMSNNAAGFEHARIATTRPINIGIGKLEFALVLGRMTRDTSQGFENNNLQKRGFDYSQPSTRQYNGVNMVFQPAMLKNIFVGFTRAFQNYEIPQKPGASFMTSYMPVLNGLYKNNYADDTLSKDQILSVYTRWLFPKNNAEVYFEYGFNDAKQNVRDLLIDMSHSSAYTFGFKKLHTLTDTKYLDLGFEATKMSQTPSYIQRSAGNWYEHGQVYEGFTNNNQIIGAGSGQGNDLQTITLDLREGFTAMGIKFQHIAHNPYLEVGENAVKLRNTKWDDYVFGAHWGYRYKKIIINANIEWVKARNYNWMNATHKGNIYAFINTIFLW